MSDVSRNASERDRPLAGRRRVPEADSACAPRGTVGLEAPENRIQIARVAWPRHTEPGSELPRQLAIHRLRPVRSPPERGRGS